MGSTSVTRFLHHSWQSRNPYTTEKKLFKEIKRVVDKDSAGSFLDTLVADAKFYRQVLEPDGHKWNKKEREIADSIRALNLFRVVQPVPMMLSIIRAYANKELTLRQTKSIFRTMENFHLQFTGVTSQRTGGGTAFMYAYSARQLLEAQSKDEGAQVLKEFVEKLGVRVPSYGEFEAGFAEIRFSDESTKPRQLVRYILRRIDESLRKEARPDYDQMTIEHIAPQSPSSGGNVSTDRVGMMGNLLLVPEKLNEKLGNKSFIEKRKVLSKSGVPLDPLLEGATEWDDNLVDERTKALAKLCHQRVFKV